MNIKRNRSYTLVKLESLKFGDVFEYNDEIYVHMNPQLVQPYCSSTTPVFCPASGLVYYLSKSTDVIHYPNAELCLGNAFKG